MFAERAAEAEQTLPDMTYFWCKNTGKVLLPLRSVFIFLLGVVALQNRMILRRPFPASNTKPDFLEKITPDYISGGTSGNGKSKGTLKKGFLGYVANYIPITIVGIIYM